MLYNHDLWHWDDLSAQAMCCSLCSDAMWSLSLFLSPSLSLSVPLSCNPPVSVLTWASGRHLSLETTPRPDWSNHAQSCSDPCELLPSPPHSHSLTLLLLCLPAAPSSGTIIHYCQLSVHCIGDKFSLKQWRWFIPLKNKSLDRGLNCNLTIEYYRDSKSSVVLFWLNDS